MLGLAKIPQNTDLEQAYSILELAKRKQGSLSSTDLALWSQWTRFDPRLGELWISAVLAQFEKLNIFELRAEILKQPWPACAGVLLDQLVCNVPMNKRSLVRKWVLLCTSGVRPAQGENYYIGVFPFGGKRQLEDAEFSFHSFLKWGFFAQTLFTNKASTRAKTELSQAQRQKILNKLIKQGTRFSVEDYLRMAPEGLSRRQAQLDLLAQKRLRAIGKTRNRFYLPLKTHA